MYTPRRRPGGDLVDTRAVVFIIIALAIGWVLQLLLAYRQARSFNRRVRALRSVGETAVGRAGSRSRGVVFAAIAADPAGVVRAAEVLKGVTVFARPRPLPQIVGKEVRALAETGSKKTTDRALARAAMHLLADDDDEGGEGS
jgi:glucitol operon activator protein